MTQRLRSLIPIIGLAFILNACSNDTIDVSKQQLQKGIVSAEIFIPSHYTLNETDEHIARQLSSNTSEVWKLPGTPIKITLRLTNITDNTIQFAHPSDCYYLDIDTKGTSIKTIWAPNSIHFSGPSLGMPQSIEPGKDFDIVIHKLDLPQRISSWKGFATEPGITQIRASIKAYCKGENMNAIYARSAWKEITVNKE